LAWVVMASLNHWRRVKGEFGAICSTDRATLPTMFSLVEALVLNVR
jgi:hypothetical protein